MEREGVQEFRKVVEEVEEFYAQNYLLLLGFKFKPNVCYIENDAIRLDQSIVLVLTLLLSPCVKMHHEILIPRHTRI
jgi:hypothetical protein